MTISYEAEIMNLSHDGRGVARINGKTIFIDNALENETVRFIYKKKHSSFDEGKAIEILKASKERVSPICQHYGVCGGCQLQHLNIKAQQAFKQNAFLEQLEKFAQSVPETLLPPLTGPTQQYRRRARLGVKYVAKKQAVLVGFREKDGRYLADLKRCEILAAPFLDLIQPMQALFNSLSIGRHIPQVEIAVGDTQAAIVIRHLQPIAPLEIEQLLSFSEQHKLWLYLQPGGLDSIHRVWPPNAASSLEYRLEEEALSLFFEPCDFIQINRAINQKMVLQACRLLELKQTDHVLELFSGLGNFSLAIAKQCQKVTGIEGSDALTQRAQLNAQHNHIPNSEFHTADLFKPLNQKGWVTQMYQKLLIDPPRSGALKIIPYLTQWKPERIVYVSCNPATLARDTHALKEQGYHLKQAGLVDMFPHTYHSEWMCLFVKSHLT